MENLFCEKHGEYEKQTLQVLGTQITLRCPKCQDEEKQAEDAKALQEALNKEAERVARWTEIARIPKRYRDFTFTPFTNQQKAVSDWDYSKNIALIGDVGSGKTKYACYLLMRAIKEGKTAKYTTMSEISANIRDSWTSKVTSEVKIIDELVACDVLVVDEIGRGMYEDWHFRIFDGRYNEGKPTIVLGNVGFNEFITHLGNAITSRLRGGGVISINFGKVDNRKDGL